MRYLLFLILLSSASLQAQALSLGDNVPATGFDLLAQRSTPFSTEDLRGQVILLDFWATWCGSCIQAMPHLDSLQEAFPNDLNVIALSEEDRPRLAQFRQNTEHRFHFARDSGAFRSYFPYYTIPHAVLIDPAGKVAAITQPENITAEVITALLRGEPIDLPRKKDNLQFDPETDYFAPDSTVRETFELRPYHPELPSFIKTYVTNGPFSGRRIAAYNLTIPGLYREAYRISHHRMELEIPDSLVTWEKPQNRFCTNLIVDDPADLYPVFQQQLSAHLPLKSRWEQRTKKVFVLQRITDAPFAGQPVPAPDTGYTGRGDGFSTEGSTLGDFCDYLEGFGIFGGPVIDGTGLTGPFAFSLSFAPEDPTTFKTALEALGLTYATEERSLDVLVLFQLTP
ncbi:MAG: redoxin domain-containing protein [Bacteroidota bacterium]